MENPLPTGRLSTHLRSLRDGVRSLKPQPSPDMLTSHTTRGVIRRPLPSTIRGSGRKTTARWA